MTDQEARIEELEALKARIDHELDIIHRNLQNTILVEAAIESAHWSMQNYQIFTKDKV